MKKLTCFLAFLLVAILLACAPARALTPVVTPEVSYTASGSTTSYSFLFRVWDESDLIVTVDEVVQLIGSAYTVTGVGDAAGGSVDFVSPPAAAAVINILRQMPLARATDYTTGGRLSASTLNDDIDKVVTQLQDVGHTQNTHKSILDRALKFPAGDATNAELPAVDDRKSKMLGFDAAGVPTALTTTSAGFYVVSKTPVADALAQYGAAGDLQATNIFGKVDTLADLRATTGSTGKYSVFLEGRLARGDGGQDLFVWAASDLSAKVNIDPLGGMYVPPNSDPSGATGAWVRQTKLILPQHVGAIANDSSTAAKNTNSTALQAAFDLSHYSGKPIYLDGMFHTDTPLEYYGGMKITGTGVDSGFVTAAAGSFLFNTFDASNRYDVVFRDFLIDGAGGDAVSVAVYIDRLYHVELKNIKIDGHYIAFNKAGVLLNNDAAGNTAVISINDCKFMNMGEVGNRGHALMITGSAGGSGVASLTIKGTRLQGNGGYGIYSELASTELSVFGGDIEGNYLGEIFIEWPLGVNFFGTHFEHVGAITSAPILLGTATYPATAVNIIGCNFSGGGAEYIVDISAGIGFGGSFTGNTFSNFTIAAIKSIGLDAASISGNRIASGLPILSISDTIQTTIGVLTGDGFVLKGGWADLFSAKRSGAIRGAYATYPQAPDGSNKLSFMVGDIALNNSGEGPIGWRCTEAGKTHWPGTGTTVLGSDTMTAVNNWYNWDFGEPIKGEGIPAGTTVISTSSAAGGTVVMSQVATASATLVDLYDVIFEPLGFPVRKGTTAERPVGLGIQSIGYMYFDTTLDADGLPIWWNGVKWIKSDGTDA